MDDLPPLPKARELAAVSRSSLSFSAANEDRKIKLRAMRRYEAVRRERDVWRDQAMSNAVRMLRYQRELFEMRRREADRLTLRNLSEEAAR